ncbi:small integral membrane protein 19 isoform X3 [Vulpes lagopus]|uniref:small integral membrane protein 19 isoform X3 n=1 Tax=Vulpes lagopus TaxID=494514 RepID=UPI001BCA1DD3|nr:small integral membrane protein 19 isoform X3 [Vulpes lagopus]
MTKAEVVQVRSVPGSLACGPDSGGKRPARSSLAARRLGSQQRTQTSSVSEDRKRKSQECCESCCKELPMPGGYGVMGDDGSMDYSVHEAWNEATNVYLVVILVSFVLFMYAKRPCDPWNSWPIGSLDSGVAERGLHISSPIHLQE